MERWASGLAAQFESRPSLGPWTFDDSSAEEAFTVYDHPRVSVFLRDAPHVGSLVAASLADVDERGAVAVLPKVAQDAPILFTPEDAATVRREAGWPDVYRERPLEGWAAVLAWYGAGLGLTLALWPLLARALGMLPDAGYAAARVLAPALAVLPVVVAGRRWTGALRHAEHRRGRRRAGAGRRRGLVSRRTAVVGAASAPTHRAHDRRRLPRRLGRIPGASRGQSRSLAPGVRR